MENQIAEEPKTRSYMLQNANIATSEEEIFYLDHVVPLNARLEVRKVMSKEDAQGENKAVPFDSSLKEKDISAECWLKRADTAVLKESIKINENGANATNTQALVEQSDRHVNVNKGAIGESATSASQKDKDIPISKSSETTNNNAPLVQKGQPVNQIFTSPFLIKSVQARTSQADAHSKDGLKVLGAKNQNGICQGSPITSHLPYTCTPCASLLKYDDNGRETYEEKHKLMSADCADVITVSCDDADNSSLGSEPLHIGSVKPLKLFEDYGNKDFIEDGKTKHDTGSDKQTRKAKSYDAEPKSEEKFKGIVVPETILQLALLKKTCDCRSKAKCSENHDIPTQGLAATQQDVCEICKTSISDPRFLFCLHSFCLDCLENMEPLVFGNSNNTNNTDKSLQSSVSGRKALLCPICDSQTEIPKQGIRALPVNYVAHNRKMKLKKTPPGGSKIICDLCSSEHWARYRCTECLLNLCTFCREAHARQRRTVGHVVLSIYDDRFKSTNLLSATVNALNCSKHADEQVVVFCETCDKPLCHSCCMNEHRDHKCGLIPDVSDKQTSVIINLLAQTKPQIQSLETALNTIIMSENDMEKKFEEVSASINDFINNNMKALEVHRQKLLSETAAAKERKQNTLRLQKVQLEQLLSDFQHSSNVTEEILHESSTAELLALKRTLVRRLRSLNRIKIKQQPKESSFIRFLPTEKVSKVDGFYVSGTITSQLICPEKCLLRADSNLNNAREGNKLELVLQSMDIQGHVYLWGGETVRGQLIPRNIARGHPTDVHVIDRQDGTYLLEILPENSGYFSLQITVSGCHIQGSPFDVNVKSKWLKHSGIFHCCSFCSSGGRKDAICACKGKMTGGFKGCGHKHPGHPGRKHWSCCGKTSEHSSCARYELRQKYGVSAYQQVTV